MERKKLLQLYLFSTERLQRFYCYTMSEIFVNTTLSIRYLSFQTFFSALQIPVQIVMTHHFLPLTKQKRKDRMLTTEWI